MNKYPLFDPVLGIFDRLGDSPHCATPFPMLGSGSLDRQDLQHNRRTNSWRPVRCLFFVFLSLSLTLSGCYWLKYNKLMRTHVELLLAMSDKVSGLLEDQRRITPTMMNEFTYPLERAEDFVRIVKRYYAGRKSLQTFEEMLAVYTPLVQEADRLRILQGDLSGFQERVRLLQEHAERVEAALVEEES
jgi:hypothetical protein